VLFRKDPKNIIVLRNLEANHPNRLTHIWDESDGLTGLLDSFPGQQILMPSWIYFDIPLNNWMLNVRHKTVAILRKPSIDSHSTSADGMRKDSQFEESRR
jgi:hypothetical protein